MKNITVETQGGLSLSTLLGVVFIVLKLTEVINWSWWWVLFPFYWWIVLLLVILIIAGLYVTIKTILTK